MWDKVKFLSCLFYIILPIFLFSQSAIPTELRFAYKQAQNFIQQQKYDSAQIYLDQVFEYAEGEPVWEKRVEANLFSLQAEIFKAKQEYSLAETNLQKALSIRLQLYGENDSIVATTYHNIGVLLKEMRDIQNAFTNLEKALNIQEKLLPPNSPSIAITYNSLMNVLNDLGRYREALSFGEKALAINQAAYGTNSLDAAINLHNIGNVYRGMGAYSEALKFLKQAFDIRTSNLDTLDVQLGDSYYSFAHTAKEMGNYSQAAAQLLKARNIYKKNKDPKELEANVFLGIIYGERGDYERAIAHNQIVLDHHRAHTGPEHPTVIGVLQNIAVCQLEAKQFNASLLSTQKALDIQKIVYRDSHISLAQSFDMLAKAYIGLGDTAQAESYFQKALYTAEQLLEPANPKIGVYHNSLGRFYVLTGNRSKALFHYNRGKEIYQTAGIENHPDIARTHQQLARMYLREGYHSQAFESLQKAFDIMELSINVEAPVQNLPPVSYIFSQPLLLELFGLLGEMWYATYLKSKRKKDIHKAEQAFKLAVDAVDSVRLSYLGKNSKLILSEKAQNIYRPALQVSRVQYEKYNKRESLDRIFFLMEKSKSAWLNEAIQEMSTETNVGVNPEILLKERELKVSLNHAIEQLFAAETQNQANGIDLWRQKRFAIQQQLDSLINIIKRDYPQYYKLTYHAKLPSTKDIQASLEEESLLINYYIGGRTLFIFCLTKNDEHLIIQQLPQNHFGHIQRFRQSVNDLEYIRQYPQQADSIFLAEAHLWYQLAIEPALAWANEEIKRLILIPYGQMGFIPFDALITEETQSPADYRRLPYLINSFQISRLYTSSLAIKKDKSFSLFAQNEKSFAGFAPDYPTLFTEQLTNNSSQNIRVELGGLPGAKKEVENIQAITDGKIWIDQAATKTEFLANASEFSLLHLAMHGIVNHTNPYYSYLYFNPREASHKLYASELYNLDLTADLVVLSACNSGAGNVLEGEGIMSLSHAFSYAGVSSLVMTLWSISDETTANLMQSFYQNLLSGEAKDNALRNAKLDYLKQADPFYAHPFFWAAFVPIGDMSPISLSQGFPLWIWFILGLMLTSGIFAMIKKFVYDRSTHNI